MPNKKSYNDELRNYILAGLLSGGGVAAAVTLARTRKLNKKLKKYKGSELEHDEDTILVPVSKDKLAMDKSAEAPDVYKLTALTGSGVLSYMALSALYRRIEDNRMKKLEAEARAKAVARLVGSEKKAQVGWAVSNIDKVRNVMALLALIGSAALVKKKLDRDNVDSDKLKSIEPEQILFQGTDKRGSDMSKQSALVSDPVLDVKGDKSTLRAAARIHKILHDSPETARALTGSILESAGYGKMNFLQNIPGVRKLMQNIILKRIGLGSSYRPGWDPESEENSYKAPRRVMTKISPEEASALNISKIRKEILKNKGLREHMIAQVAKKQKLNSWIQAYLRHHPEKLLDRLGIVTAPARLSNA